MRIKCYEDKCTGCKLCSVMCASFHYKSFNPRHGRIKIIKEEPDIDIPIVCRQCKNPRCMDACEESAIILENNTVKVIDEKCIGCGRCVDACPFGAIFMHPTLNKAIKCDLCNGDPECVKWCPVSALEVIE